LSDPLYNELEARMSEAFGSLGRQCAEDSPRHGARRRPTPLEEELGRLLRQYDPKCEERIKRTVTQWSNSVRAHLRSETALYLRSEETSSSVPIRVVPGIPDSFGRVLDELRDVRILELLMNLGRIRDAAGALKVVDRNYEAVEQLLKDRCARPEEVSHTASTVESLADMLSALALLKEIRSIDEDILGTYYFRVPVIEIYWMAIAICAGLFGVSLEGLTVVVLTHELAHAYTHKGFDIDGVDWDTKAFGNASIFIVEGLAQFYTDEICRKLASRSAAPAEAFHKMLEEQPPPYTEYVEWTKGLQKGGEVVRMAMIDTRRRGIDDYGEFREQLESAKERIYGKKAL
jgi:hypothetical protein